MNFLSWFAHTNKGIKEVNIPTAWAGVSLKQYISLTEWDGKDLIDLFSSLSGLSVKALNETVDPGLYDSLERSTRFIYEEERKFLKAEKPKKITVNGKTLNVPANLNGLTIGQSIRVREALDKTKVLDEASGKYYVQYEKVMPIALANYFQPQYDGTEYNDDRALEILPHFENMPVVEGYGIAVFLLRPLIGHGQTIGQRLSLLIQGFLKASSARELA